MLVLATPSASCNAPILRRRSHLRRGRMILDDFFCRIGAFLISDYAVVNVIPRTSPIEISMVDNPVHADHAVLLWEKPTMS